jgi:hypothetical protein
MKATNEASDTSLGAQIANSNNTTTESVKQTKMSMFAVPKTGKKSNTGSASLTVAKDRNQPSVYNAVSQAGIRKKQTNLNHAILRLICMASLPPTILDYPEWTEVISFMNPSLRSVCGGPPMGKKTCSIDLGSTDYKV